MNIIKLLLKVKNFLMLQTAPATSGEPKQILSYDTAFSHKEGKKNFYTISYIHNRDVVPGSAVKQAKKIKHTIV